MVSTAALPASGPWALDGEAPSGRGWRRLCSGLRESLQTPSVEPAKIFHVLFFYLLTKHYMKNLIWLFEFSYCFSGKMHYFLLL